MNDRGNKDETILSKNCRLTRRNRLKEENGSITFFSFVLQILSTKYVSKNSTRYFTTSFSMSQYANISIQIFNSYHHRYQKSTGNFHQTSSNLDIYLQQITIYSFLFLWKNEWGINPTAYKVFLVLTLFCWSKYRWIFLLSTFFFTTCRKIVSKKF